MQSIRSKIFAAALLVPFGLATAPAQAADIVETAAANPDFTILVKMINAAGLAETLKGPGPFTVFAPSDAAFAKWPKKEVELFLNPAKKEHLVRLLKHHVVPGKVMAADLKGKKTDAKTVEGTMVKVDAMGDVMVDGNKVVKADIVADNGVIHVIDTPLLPEKYRGSF